MKFSQAIDLYVADMKSQGRMNSDATERNYRITLDAHCEDIGGYDPAFTTRDDIKKTLRRWPHPNTQRKNRSILVSFYDWCMEEGHRDTNPVRQTRRPKGRPTKVYRLTKDEAAAMLAACQTTRERRIIYLGICAGLRSAELRGLQGRHFSRPGFVHVSTDIGKNGRERWIPVIAELAPVVEDIRRTVAADEFVIPSQRWRDPGVNRERQDRAKYPASRQVLRTVVMDVGRRAGIAAHIHPHLMRHAFGDHITRYAGIRNAQAVMGHADVKTTQGYTGQPTLDELLDALEGFGFRTGTTVRRSRAGFWLEAPTGIEPVEEPSRAVGRNLGDALLELRAAFAPLVKEMAL